MKIEIQIHMIRALMTLAALSALLACQNSGFKVDADSQVTAAADPKDPKPKPDPKPDPDPIPDIPDLDFKEMVLAGYQGWFSTPKDQILSTWKHWYPDTPGPNRITFELYPDVREYPAASLADTQLGPLGNGQPAKLFSSFHEGVVDTHYRWMKEYGIDGVVLGRFMVATYDATERRARNKIVELVKKYALKYSRFFYISYDLTNARMETLYDDLTRDWNEQLQGQLKVTSSPVYARADDKPVIMLWGIDQGAMNQDRALELIRFFKNKGFYVVGGIQWGWREATDWHFVYKELNMIQPWTVGSYASDADVENFYKERFKPDRTKADEWKLDYQNVMFPGFSWSNWGGGPRNAFPRRGGDFMWRQAYWISNVSQGALVAMFDEYDEGTAIAKAAENASQIPSNQYFLTLDADGVAVSSDFYLRLTGEITKLLRNKRSRVYDVPISRK